MIPGLYKCFDHWHQNGDVWICSDPHFNDSELDHIVPNRPTAEEQIKLINSKVGRKSTLIILGDIGDPECVRQLRGYKILIAGNHDAGLSNYSDIFDEVYGGPLMIGEKLILSHEPVDVSWAFNIHGHDHSGWDNKPGYRLNVCLDRNEWIPLNFNRLMRNGLTSKVDSIHRTTINNATKRSKKKKGKK